MRLAMIASAFPAVFAVTSASAQEAQEEGPKLACPASGYAKPWYGMAGDNDGQLRGYEIASPCVGKELRDAAVAIGMGRWKPLGVKTLTTLRFQADGDIANGAGKMLTGAKVDMGINFTIPAARLAVTTANSTEIRAFNGKRESNEQTP